MVARTERRPALLYGAVALAATGLLIYSQTLAFNWDSGFHILAAQLIRHGKRPYVDFLFPQTPLNAYWNAAWMGIFGESWRAVQAVAAVTTALATLLAADFVYRYFPTPAWRLAAAIVEAAIIATNVMVVGFAPTAQAYALCMLGTVAAFRATIVAVDFEAARWPALAGFFAGVAASASLLTAPVGPILLAWMLIHDRTGQRWAKLGFFISGGLLASVPLLSLFLERPSQTIFNVFDYHFYYRQVWWEGAAAHDLDVAASWVDSGQALLVALLGIGGVLCLGRSEVDRRTRSRFYLSGWLSAGLGAYLLTARPTFPQYFMLLVPFLGMLATVGLQPIGEAFAAPDRPFWPALTLICLLGLALGKRIHDDRPEHFTWPDMEEIAKEVDAVTLPGTALLAEEQIYFLTRRTPPVGAEHYNSHKLSLPPSLSAALHVVPRDELEQRIEAGAFPTLQTCADEDEIERLGLARIYAHRMEVNDCVVFWDPLRQ
jgi:hypothetical protein